jgi:hypothetical protein
MLLFKDPTANYASNNVGRVIRLTSNRTNLKGEFLLGRDFATSKFNSAYDGAPAAVAGGAPTYGTHKVTVDGTNYLDTLIGDNADITIAVVTTNNAGITTFLATPFGTAGGQLALFRSGAGLQANMQVTNAANSATGLIATTPGSITTPITDFRMLSGRVSGLVNPSIKVDEFKGGARVQGASVAGSATRQLTDKTIRLAGLSAIPGAIDQTAVLIWHEMLSDAALLAAYQEVRTQMATMGITC